MCVFLNSSAWPLEAYYSVIVLNMESFKAIFSHGVSFSINLDIMLSLSRFRFSRTFKFLGNIVASQG